jgi:type IV secretory pathway TrbF-like protein
MSSHRLTVANMRRHTAAMGISESSRIPTAPSSVVAEVGSAVKEQKPNTPASNLEPIAEKNDKDSDASSTGTVIESPMQTVEVDMLKLEGKKALRLPSPLVSANNGDNAAGLDEGVASGHDGVLQDTTNQFEKLTIENPDNPGLERGKSDQRQPFSHRTDTWQAALSYENVHQLGTAPRNWKLDAQKRVQDFAGQITLNEGLAQDGAIGSPFPVFNEDEERAREPEIIQAPLSSNQNPLQSPPVSRQPPLIPNNAKGEDSPFSRRTSNAGSTYTHISVPRTGLRRMSTAEASAVTGFTPISRCATINSGDGISVYSEATRLIFDEADKRLEQFVHDNEPDEFKEKSAEQIPTEVDESLKQGSFSFDCSFGWTGDEATDLEETAVSQEAYIEKLDDAKDGIAFVTQSVVNYQGEINSRKKHKFTTLFLGHQNQACVVTLNQLDEIQVHIDEVIEEIRSLKEDDDHLKEKLVTAYKHAVPWVKRTRRLVAEAHIFYKLNYVLGRQQKTTKTKRPLATIPAGRVVPQTSVSPLTSESDNV